MSKYRSAIEENINKMRYIKMPFDQMPSDDLTFNKSYWNKLSLIYLDDDQCDQIGRFIGLWATF